MALTLLKWTIVQVISLIQRHHCLRHRPFDHQFIGCIDIDTWGGVPPHPKKSCIRYIYVPLYEEVRDNSGPGVSLVVSVCLSVCLCHFIRNGSTYFIDGLLNVGITIMAVDALLIM